MGSVKNWFKKSRYIEPLPPACRMCAEGCKMVVLVTGLCPSSCYYCPLSLEKKGKDRVFADEWELENEDDIDVLIREAELIDACGAGITGGDPLMVPSRARKYIGLLKDYFGSDFHIHLYTSGLKNIDSVSDFVNAGLDEIRFHPSPRFWNKMEKSDVSKSVEKVVDYGLDVAVEIPSIPGMNDQILSLVRWAEDKNLCWVNLNELEFSETNQKNLLSKGFVAENDFSSHVKDSESCALDVIDKCFQENLDIGVHYCSCSFKDAVQLRNRIRRRAENIVKPHEIISNDGTLVLAVVSKKGFSLDKIRKMLIDIYNVDSEMVFVNKKKNRVETGVWFLDKFSEILLKNGFKCFMIEEYPTYDRLEVERINFPI